MSNTYPPSLIVADDGFLWYAGHKLPARLVNGGIEYHEKDPRRSAACGGPLYVVPFSAFLELFAGYAGVAFNLTVIEVQVKECEV